MELPYELLEYIFYYVDVKNILYKVDNINRKIDDIFRSNIYYHQFWKEKIRSSYLEKRELFKTYNSSIFTYHNFCQTSIEYWMKHNGLFLDKVLYYTDKETLNDIKHSQFLSFNKLYNFY